MNSRERVLKAVAHEEPDRVPIDLGGSIVTGIMAGALVRLRRHLGLTETARIYDAFQMLGEVALDLVERFDIDVLPVEPEAITFAHLRRRDYKPWRLFDGTPVQVPGAFDVTLSPEGDWLLHEDGDPAGPVVARMPKDGYYFDKLSVTGWDYDYQPPSIESLRQSAWRRLTQEDLRDLQEHARVLRQTTDKALVMTNWGDAVLGPPSAGSVAEWLIVLVSEPAYVQELMDLAAERALENLKLYQEAIGTDIDIISVDGSDYGSQDREMFSPALFERYHEPYYKTICDWIHTQTPWKISKHCCGSIPRLIESMIRAGIDILNPVQTSAVGMDARTLKDTFGDRITFWGGGVDTQNVFSFGTPDDVRRDVEERLRIFGPGGGFVWAAIHNIQYTVPPENIVAALDAIRDYGQYPLVTDHLRRTSSS
ncbi:MAG: methyltransferase [Anaerolineae bacterium]|nr:methyltransferase [Anaerolineae bacterium]